MGPIHVETDIDAPRERIHEYLMDIATRPELYGDLLCDFRLLRIQSRGVGAGARFKHGKRTAWEDSSITQAEPGRISERGVTGFRNRTKTGTEWELSEFTNGVTTVRITYWTEPFGMAKIFDRLTGRARWHRRRLKHAARRLRELMEADQSPVITPVGIGGGNRHATGVF